MNELEQRVNLYLSNTSTTAYGFEENIDIYDMIKDALMEFVPQETKELKESIDTLNHNWNDAMTEITNLQKENKDLMDNLNIRIDYYKKELADANEKLVNTSCNYVKCFKYLKGVVKVLKNVYDPIKPACLEEVEQFIKENE